MFAKGFITSVLVAAVFAASIESQAKKPIPCPNAVLAESKYVGEQKNVLAQTFACSDSNLIRDTVVKRQSGDPDNVCGATCETFCFTPSGGGPDPNECNVIADALLYDSENIGALFTVPPASNSSVIVMTYNSCETFFVNQASTNLTYCRTDWSSLVNYVAFNCQATQNAHGGDCVATDQRWFVQIQHS